MNRILFLSGSYNQCGGVYSMLTLINELKSKGYFVELVVGNHGTAENIEQEFNVHSHYIKSYNWIVSNNKRRNITVIIKNQIKKILNIWSEIRLYCFIKSYNPDIVVMNSSDQYVGIKSCNCLKIPVVMHFREYMTYDHGTGYWSKNMARKYFEKLDGGIAISRDIKRYFSVYKIKNLRVIYNGVDTKKYEIYEDKRMKSTYNISCVGRLCQGKNQKLALEAAQLLIENDILNFHIYFYGSDKNEYSEMLKKYTREQGLEAYVSFMGLVDDPREIYGRAHINLLCSTREAFGRVIVEGMLNHCLNVVADRGGAEEIIEDGVNGLLFKPNDVKSLYQVMVNAMNNYEKMDHIIEQGYQDAKEKYSSEKNTKNIEMYLKYICATFDNEYVRGDILLK